MTTCQALWFPLSFVFLMGCTGILDGESGRPGGAGASVGNVAGSGNSGVGGGGATGPTVPPDCSSPSAAPLHALLLTPHQYEHAVEDILKVAGAPAKDFGGGVAARLDEIEVERRANAAAAVAAEAVKTASNWAPCLPPAVDAASCEAQLIDQVGSAAFRRPLTDAEKAGLKTLFDAGITEKDFATGLEWLLTGLLQSPDFLYQLVKPSPGEKAGQVVALGPYELASRLAFFVWDGIPDQALLESARSGTLGNVEQLDVELERMFADPRFKRGLAGFYSSWLRLEGFREVARDDPGLTTDVSSALQQSLLMSATELYSAASPNISGLLSGDSYYLNAPLRSFYGVGGGDATFAPTTLPNQGRHGILTHPALMTLLARPKESNPIARGLFLQRTVLCNEIPPPPDGISIPPLAPVMEGQPTRKRLEQHTQNALCAGCHTHIDPPGFAFESYDEVGRYRTMDAGLPVDTSGVMADGTDLGGPFANGQELLARIASSLSVKECFAEHYLAYALARDLATEDACSASQITNTFGQTGDLKQLVALVARSDAFRLRATEDGAVP
jgi:hypothetical protein